MSEQEHDDLFTIALNSLAFRTLNSVPYEPYENVEEALYGLADWIRKGSLAIAMGLHDIANAIRAMEQTP